MKAGALCLLVVLMALCMSAGADPVVIDLAIPYNPATDPLPAGMIDGGVFRLNPLAPTGTGNLQSFLSVQDGKDGFQEGWNYAIAEVMDTKRVPQFTHDILLGDIPIYVLDGIKYFEYYLDVNEPGGTKTYLSLDSFELYVSDTAHLTDPPYPHLGSPRYDMDKTETGNTVLLDAGSVGSGSGSGDVQILIPESIFIEAGDDPEDYVYAYVAFGGYSDPEDPRSFIAESGFEELAVQEDAPRTFGASDFGDLPDTYKTTIDNDGAVHRNTLHEWLGATVDRELDGVPTDKAYGDDEADTDDEDGVEFNLDTGIADVTISVADYADSRYDGLLTGMLYLDAWWDADADGTFNEATEHAVAEMYDPSSTEWQDDGDGDLNVHTVEIAIPGFTPHSQGDYFRWRLNYGAASLSYGESSYGEVEDYYVIPEPCTMLLLGASVALLARRRRRRNKSK